MPLGASRLTLLAFQAVEVTAAAEVIRKRAGIQANGDAQTDTVSYFGGGSALFDGTEDWLQVDTNPIPTSGDFTVEFWFRPASVGTLRPLWSNRDSDGTHRGTLYINTSSQLTWWNGSDNVNYLTPTLSVNTWHHIACVMDGSTRRLFLNGDGVSATSSFSVGEILEIGAAKYTSTVFANELDGHIDEFRVSNTARYTANFSPPRYPFGNDLNTTMLLHCDGTDGGKFFEDDNGEFGRHPVQVNVVGGNTQIDTAQSQFGGASALFDGTDDYIDLSFRSDILTTTETIEFWYRPTSVSGVYGIMSQNTQGAGTGFQILQINGEISAYKQANGGTTLQGGSLSANTWVHIAVVNDGGSAALYIDGTSVDTDGSWTGTTTDTDLRIGEGKGISSSTWNSTRYDLNGHIDELRISDSARYTAGFTVASDPFTNDENTRLLMHFDGTDTSTHFPDDFGTRPATGVGAFGNAQIDTSEYKFGGSSALFDGSGDYLEIAASASGQNNPVMGLKGDYTIECFVNFDNVSSGTHGIIGGDDTSPYHSLQQSSGTVSWQNPYLTESGLSTNTWYHIAVSREGSTVRLFVDGALSGSGTNSDEIFPGPTSNYNVFIGRDAFTSGYFDGHIDEVRVSNVCRYTQAFTPPAQQFTNDPNTLLLMHMDGTDTSTVFRDDNGTQGRGEPVGATAKNDAQISTAQSKFGGSSAVFDGTNDVIALGPDDNSSYVLWPQTGEFTVEGFFRYSGTVSGSTRAMGLNVYGAFGDSNPTGRSWMGIFDGNHTFSINGGGTVTGSSANSDQWYHLAAVRDSANEVRFYVDGTEVGTSFTSSQTIASGYVALGAIGNNYGYDWNGHIDEVRISSVCRYTANFTPTTEPFTNDANTLALFHFNGANGSTEFLDDCGRQQVGIKATGNGNTDTAQSKFGGTSYSASAQGNYLDLDDFGGLANGDWTMEAFIRYNVLSGAQMIFDWRPPSTQGFYPTLYTSGSSLIYYTNSGSRINSGSVLSTGTWYHFALCKSGSDTKLFIDGTQVGSTYTDNNTYFGARLRLFGDGFTAGNATLDGFADEVRVSKSARYTANFTPTTESFQNDSNTLLLMHMDGTDGENDFTDDNGKEKN